MSSIIGIIARPSVSQIGHKISIAYNDVISAIRKSGGIPIVVSNDSFDDYLNICDGFILQGGDIASEKNLKILKKIRDIDVPVLGICLGMQEMGLLCGGTLVDIPNHTGNIKHTINIIKDSLLYKILGTNRIIVNSRHKSAIMSPKIKVCAVAHDKVIEAIYDDNLTFFLGIEWHPENMYDEDINAKKIFDYFVKICNDKACK